MDSVSRAIRTPTKYVKANPKITEMVCAAITEVTPRGISAAVNRLVRGGHLVTGDRLPTVRDLSAKLGIGRQIMQNFGMKTLVVNLTVARLVEIL